MNWTPEGKSIVPHFVCFKLRSDDNCEGVNICSYLLFYVFTLIAIKQLVMVHCNLGSKIKVAIWIHLILKELGYLNRFVPLCLCMILALLFMSSSNLYLLLFRGTQDCLEETLSAKRRCLLLVTLVMRGIHLFHQSIEPDLLLDLGDLFFSRC